MRLRDLCNLYNIYLTTAADVKFRKYRDKFKKSKKKNIEDILNILISYVW